MIDTSKFMRVFRQVVGKFPRFTGQIPLGVAKIWNGYKIQSSQDIAFKFSQIVDSDMTITFQKKKLKISIVIIVFLLFSIVLKQ